MRDVRTMMTLWILGAAVVLPPVALPVQANERIPAASTDGTVGLPQEPDPTLSDVEKQDNPIRRVDHFYAVAADAPALFAFLVEELDLPEVWPFQDREHYATGGVSLGNVVFEVLRADFEDMDETRFRAVAFEPSGDATAAAAWLAEHGIERTEPRLYAPVGAEVHFELVHLPSMRPEEARFFVCDYKQRTVVREEELDAAEELAEKGGGPLGIVGVRELTMVTTESEAALASWVGLVGDERVEDGLVRFDTGPAIRLRSGDEPGFRSIVIEVSSLDRARRWLDERGLSAEKAEGTLVFSPPKLQGLRFVLTEQDGRVVETPVVSEEIDVYPDAPSLGQRAETTEHARTGGRPASSLQKRRRPQCDRTDDRAFLPSPLAFS